MFRLPPCATKTRRAGKTFLHVRVRHSLDLSIAMGSTLEDVARNDRIAGGHWRNCSPGSGGYGLRPLASAE